MTHEEEKIFKEARKRVRRKKEFYSHLISYFTVGLFLTFINWYSNPGHWWVQWVWIGWGIGIFFHGIRLFKNNILFGEKWEEEEIKKEMERRKRQ
jgi:hypothetical protein